MSEFKEHLVSQLHEVKVQRDELLKSLQYWLPKEIPFRHQTSDAVCLAHNEQWSVARAAIAKVIGNTPPACKCNFRQKTVGDGCAVCNPELAADTKEGGKS